MFGGEVHFSKREKKDFRIRGENMDNRNHKKTRILILIPIIVFAVAAICLTPLIISYFTTGSDVAAVAIIFTGSVILILTALPCMVMSIIGTVFAARAIKDGQSASRKFFVMGIIEIAVYSLGVMGAAVAAFITILAVKG